MLARFGATGMTAGVASRGGAGIVVIAVRIDLAFSAGVILLIAELDPRAGRRPGTAGIPTAELSAVAEEIGAADMAAYSGGNVANVAGAVAVVSAIGVAETLHATIARLVAEHALGTRQ
jgi:hypothetical protein